VRLAAAGCALGLALCAAPAGAYDPLATPAAAAPAPVDLAVHDMARRRAIPLRVYLPASAAPAPVVLFSHGLGGSREGSAYLGRHWAARGYAAVFLQHPGSDESIWRDEPPAQRMQALRDAANFRNFALRVEDVTAVLDQLARWSAGGGHALARRLDLARVGMSGHSFGAMTTQAVSGERFGRGERSLADPRIRAAVVMSPSTPRRGDDPREAFGDVRIPWLVMTGTRDDAPIGNADVGSRLGVFPALPPGAKYELVLDGAEHGAFGDRALPGEDGRRNPSHHRAILALSTAFWDAHLRGDAAARAWLDGDGPASVLEAGDRWQRK
jgi:predicted dienelactone hydrolase